jgi:hypothetical protein
VARLEAQWHQQRHWRRQHRLLRRQKGREASALLAGLAAGGGMDSSSGGSGRGRASSGRPGEKQQRQGGAQQWPALGQQWDSPQLQQGDEAEGDESSSGEDEDEEEEEAEGPAGLRQLQQQRGQPGQQRRRVAQFRPPAFCVVTGRGRHSEAYRGGVLKAAVQEMLLLQGLPARSDPTNAGAVQWRALLPAEHACHTAACPAAVEQAEFHRLATLGIELRVELPGSVLLTATPLSAPSARLAQASLWYPGSSCLPTCSSSARPCTQTDFSLQVGAAAVGFSSTCLLPDCPAPAASHSCLRCASPGVHRRCCSAPPPPATLLIC